MVDNVGRAEATDQLEETYDTSDKEQVNKVRKRTARTRAERLKFVEAGMGVTQGRAWFFDLLKRAHIFQTPYTSGDPHATSFRCGELNLGLQILDDIQTAAPQEYIKMIEENK